MDSIDDGATINISIKNYYKKGFHLRNSVDHKRFAYSLTINNSKVLDIESRENFNDFNNYLKIYAGAAKEIGNIMKEHDVKKYTLINGEDGFSEASSYKTSPYYPHAPISKEGKEVFKKTLEKLLE